MGEDWDLLVSTAAQIRRKFSAGRNDSLVHKNKMKTYMHTLEHFSFHYEDSTKIPLPAGLSVESAMNGGNWGVENNVRQNCHAAHADDWLCDASYKWPCRVNHRLQRCPLWKPCAGVVLTRTATAMGIKKS